MRASRYFLATLKESPADAELASHKLMVRAGLIRRLAGGIYTWMPLGLRVVRKVEAIVRDEIRPRFGVMRGREFTMKDGYSFHADYADLQREYRNMYETYTRIFTRLGLKFRAVAGDPGAIGGTESREFHVLAESGEDAIAY